MTRSLCYRLLRGMRMMALLTACHFSLTPASARSQLIDLNIRVVLSRNGDARITETRRMSVDLEGTECFIGIGTPEGSQVGDLSVSDETGRTFTNIGDWDVDQSRAWKEGKCGIVSKHGGSELCWGLGQTGERTYVTSYTYTNMVHAYPDADALRHIFIDDNVSTKPSHVLLTVAMDDGTRLTEENCGAWGFRFKGNISFEQGMVVAESSEPFESRSALYIMVSFKKGLLTPAITEDDTFEHKKELAFEGSDYGADDEMTAEDIFWAVVVILCVFVLPIVWGIWYLVYVWRARKKVNQDLLWYRDIPLDGNLQRANEMVNAYKYRGPDYNNLLSACILKLVNLGAISIEQRPNKRGKLVQSFVIHDLKDADRQTALLRKTHNIFKEAAGDDTILEPKELKRFMKDKKNQNVTDSFINTLHTKKSISDYKTKLDTVRQVFGLRKFLKEFSLLDERHIGEVSLWKDYMVWATLFGIADQVIRDMKKINPDYFNMDQIANQMADERTLPMIYSTMHSSTSRAASKKAEREARASGRGGSSSWGGGGGGFSGGGFGGGVR